MKEERDEGRKEREGSGDPQRVRFHYIKSPAFHTLHADGVIGGLTPGLDLHVAFYAERFPIPKRTEHAIKEDGTLGEEQTDYRKGRKGVVRELVVDVVMDLATAERMRNWLSLHLQRAQKKLEAVDPDVPAPAGEEKE